MGIIISKTWRQHCACDKGEQLVKVVLFTLQ